MAIVEKQAYEMVRWESKFRLGAFGRFCRATVPLSLLLVPLLGWIQGSILSYASGSVWLFTVVLVVLYPLSTFPVVTFFIGLASLFSNDADTYTKLPAVMGKLVLMGYLVPLGLVGAWSVIVVLMMSFIAAFWPPQWFIRPIVDGGPFVVVVALSALMYFRYVLVARSDEVKLAGELFSLISIVVTVLVPGILKDSFDNVNVVIIFSFVLSIPVTAFALGTIKGYLKDKYFYGNDINAEGVFLVPEPVPCGLTKMIPIPVSRFLVINPNGLVLKGSVARNLAIYAAERIRRA